MIGRMWPGACAIALAGVAAILAGCAGPGASGVSVKGGSSDDRPVPGYNEIARDYNQRVERLDRLWARAVVRVEYEDDSGERRREQGEGHLQLIQPANLALSVGKLGETLLWLGCDDARYWLFEMHEADHVQVGRHANLGKPCNRPAGLPAHPLDVIELLGVTPLPLTWPGVSDSQAVGDTKWSASGEWVIVDAPGYAGYRRLFLDADSLLPQRIEIYAHPSRELTLTATLSEYQPVTVRAGGPRPRSASRVIIHSERDRGSMTIDLGDMSDGRGRSGRLSAEVFDFEALMENFRPDRVTVLDRDCERSALAPAGYGSANGSSKGSGKGR